MDACCLGWWFEGRGNCGEGGWGGGLGIAMQERPGAAVCKLGMRKPGLQHTAAGAWRHVLWHAWRLLQAVSGPGPGMAEAAKHRARDLTL